MPSRLISIRRLALICGLFASVAGSMYAQQVVNGSFEVNNLATTSNSYLYGSQATPSVPLATPWTFSNTMGAGIARAVTSGGFGVNGAVPDGTTFAFIRNSTTDTNYVNGTISQSLTFNTGGTFLLNFYEGARTGSTGSVTFGVAMGSLTLTPGLNAGATNSANGYLNSVTAGDAFRQVQYTFNVPSEGGTYNLLFTGVSSSGSNAAYLDSIAVTPVPEPTTLAGAALLAGTAVWKLRRRLTRSILRL